jgi:hypothetical protein
MESIPLEVGGVLLGQSPNSIEEKEILIDVLHNPMFQWSETLNLPSIVDWNQLQYTHMYQTPEYVASKFSGDFSNLPGFDKVIEHIAQNTKTPLDELLSRYKVIDEQQEDRNNSDLFKFKDSQ